MHEAGHMLGLAGRTNYATNFHCENPFCLMNRTIHISRYIFGLQRRPCKYCRAEMAEDAKLPPPNLRFVGPVLVREEKGYSVLSLPGRIRLVVGQYNEQDCDEFASAIRGENELPPNEPPVSWVVKDEARSNLPVMRETIGRIEADDPYNPVAFAASRAFSSPNGLDIYFADRPTADVVKNCRQSIQTHPDDGWSYNRLAWIRATDPDDSMRNAREAFDAAKKACELSEWKNWDWIDTLAAAYAENRDFKRAVEFEGEALRIGHPDETDRREMQARLALYQQSQPYRDR